MKTYFDVALALCALLVLLNWLGLASAMMQRRSYSFAPPFLAGLLASLLLGCHPTATLHRLWPLPLLLDPSLAFALSGVVFHRLKRRFRRKT